MKKVSLMVLSVCFVLSILFVGCSKKEANSSNNSDSQTNNTGRNHDGDASEKDPVTIKFMASEAISDFEEYWVPIIEEALPHITIEYIDGGSIHPNSIEEMIAKDSLPDIFFASSADDSKTLKAYELGYDLSDFIEESKDLDLSRFDPEHLQGWTTWSDDEIWLLPFMKDIFALHYNKEIFDLFGISYPTDDMTWDEVIDLAEDVTGEIDGVKYRGLHMADMSYDMLSQVAGDLQFVDPDTQDILWTENAYVVDVLEKNETAHTIPGNEFPEVPEETSAYGPFLDGTLAMLPRFFVRPTEEDGIDWDIVTFPQWEENLGTGPPADGWGLGIAATSEHKEAAFEVLELLYSDEYIMDLAETPLNAPYPDLHESGESIDHLNEDDHGHFMDKNLEALSELDPADAPKIRSKYDSGVADVMSSMIYDYLDSGQDMNTFLREIREQEETRVLEELEKE